MDLIDSRTDIDIENLSASSNLASLCIDECQVTFEEFEIFITKICSQLRVLNIRHCENLFYFNANRWERLINKHIPRLRRFNFEYIADIEEEHDRFLENINGFFSSFWIEHQWFLEIKIECKKVFYLIYPYKYI
jgi:hypothetical protein